MADICRMLLQVGALLLPFILYAINDKSEGQQQIDIRASQTTDSMVELLSRFAN